MALAQGSRFSLITDLLQVDVFRVKSLRSDPERVRERRSARLQHVS